MPQCHSCKRPLNADTDYGRQELCAGCKRPTRCCLNCIHYDRSRYNECNEPAADCVVDKEKGNFCDFFKPGQALQTAVDPKAAARAAAEALFRKGK